MADLDLDAIEARANAATDGPWMGYDERGDLRDENPSVNPMWVVAHMEAGGVNWVRDIADIGGGEQDEADAEFIAYARTDVPALVAALRDARAAIAAVRALCEQRIAEHADYVRRIQDGTLITLDRFIGPAQVNVADVLAAMDVRHDPSATTDPQSASVSPEEALTVRCGTCDADPGEACVTVGPWPGRVQRYPHESRYGKAREARPSATTDGGAS